MADETLDREEQIARIGRSQAETQKYVEESFKLMAERRKLDQEDFKLSAERRKLDQEDLKLGAEARKLGRDATFSPFVLASTAFGAGAAFFASVAAFVKLLT